MSEDEIHNLTAAVHVALGHLDLSRAEAIQVLERAVTELRLMDAIDEAALSQVAYGEGAQC